MGGFAILKLAQSVLLSKKDSGFRIEVGLSTVETPWSRNLGIVMVHAFNGEVDRRLARIELPISTRLAMDQQRARLAGAELPSHIEDDTRFAVTQTINGSLIFGFRMLILVAARLALVSAPVAFKPIENI